MLVDKPLHSGAISELNRNIVGGHEFVKRLAWLELDLLVESCHAAELPYQCEKYALGKNIKYVRSCQATAGQQT